MSRRTPIASIAVICLASAAGLTAAAHATTGVGTGLPQPRVDVAHSDGDQFTGRYAIGEIDRRAKIGSGQLQIEYTDTRKPFLIGSLGIFGFDDDGRQQSSHSITYPYSFANDTLSAPVIAQATFEPIGALRVSVPDAQDELHGQLTWRGGTYQVVFDRLPASDLQTELPEAKQVDPVPLRLRHDGLGRRDSALYGRWRLVASDVDPGRAASIYAPLVRAANSIGNDATIADSGNMTLFEVTSKMDPPRPGGMVAIHTPSQTRAEFLTDFRWDGPWRSANVRAGSDQGAIVGRYIARLVGGDRLVGTLTNGDFRVDLTFQRGGR
ncbi:hypothetical protein Q5424_23290 [Conexibacter sp. JD483]|uniref:hypothetical protein n=1 Tax=unclassified Conexibacter TaxID=2627773 RepID=UPI00271D3BFF|nr:MULTISPECIES: hypothetical protein [unclassified Conexibacter]MDO8186563.1 hypothetical protein [Conexibacter sp. CPCC 205706]MDO8196668.1 hypothetical protein [Conexibacter sp. CPCC 205762]MDR9372042.1 hypothetical protein [Conexibacter sp. JD483]